MNLLGKNIDGQLRKQMGVQGRHQLWELRAQLRDQLLDQLLDQLPDQLLDQLGQLWGAQGAMIDRIQERLNELVR